jgi:hypothetical protein
MMKLKVAVYYKIVVLYLGNKREIPAQSHPPQIIITNYPEVQTANPHSLQHV